MHTQRQTYVTAPDYLVLGTQAQRNKAVKERWIKELGGSCIVCGAVYHLEQIELKFQAREPVKQYRSNLDAHYIGESRPDHELYRLGKRQVSMKDDFAAQNQALEEFIQRLCPCELRCRPCHGRLHGKESGNCMHKQVSQLNCPVWSIYLILSLLTLACHYLLQTFRHG